MKSTTTLLMAIALLVAGCSKAQIPEARGRSIYKWIEVLRESNDPTQICEAASAIAEIGPPAHAAVDELVRLVSCDFELATLRGFSRDEVPSIMNALTNAIHAIGPAAADRILQYIEVRRQIPEKCVASLSDEALSRLATGLDHNTEHVKFSVAMLLGSAGRRAAFATPRLAEMLKDPNTEMRRDAAQALGRIAGDPAVAVPALVAALSDRETLVRYEAALSLAAFPDAGAQSAPEVTKLLVDRQPIVRKGAVLAVKALLKDVNPDQAAPWLIAMLDYRGSLDYGRLVMKDRGYDLSFVTKYVNPYLTLPAAAEHQVDESVYQLAEEILIKMNRLGDAAPILLISYLFGDDPEKAWQAAEGMAKFGKKPDPVWRETSDWFRMWMERETTTLNRLEILNTPERIRKRQAIREKMYVGLGKEIVPKLSGLLFFGAPKTASAQAYNRDTDRTWHIRAEAARGLGNIGAPASSAIPMLEIASRDDKHPEVVAAATKAIEQIRAAISTDGK